MCDSEVHVSGLIFKLFMTLKKLIFIFLMLIAKHDPIDGATCVPMYLVLVAPSVTNEYEGDYS